MALMARVQRLERTTAARPDGYRRCRVCHDGEVGRGLARFEDVPGTGERGATGAPPTRCPACGREPADVVVVRGVVWDLL
jgi:hypothetical protein